jgi:hypothetical protein
MNRLTSIKCTLIGSAVVLPLLATAQVGKIANPLVTQGQWELDYNLVDYLDDNPALNNDLRQKLSLEYGLTGKWAIEAGAEWRRSDSESLHTDSVFFEVKREFTDQKDGWWLSSGAKAEYVLNTSGDSDALEVKLLLQKEHGDGKFRHRANITLRREVGSSASSDVAFRTRWYSRWNAHPNFKPAIEWHAAWGNVDNFNSWEDQRQYIGPAVHGQLFKHGQAKANYEIAYVFGVTDASRGGALRLRIETMF